MCQRCREVPSNAGRHPECTDSQELTQTERQSRKRKRTESNASQSELASNVDQDGLEPGEIPPEGPTSCGLYSQGVALGQTALQENLRARTGVPVFPQDPQPRPALPSADPPQQPRFIGSNREEYERQWDHFRAEFQIYRETFANEWERNNPPRRNPLFVRALGQRGPAMPTLGLAFPYLPLVSLVVIVHRLWKMTFLLNQVKWCVNHQLALLTGDMSIRRTAFEHENGLRITPTNFSTLFSGLLFQLREWTALVCIVEGNRLQWAENARRLRNPQPSPHAELVWQRLIDIGLLMDEIVPTSPLDIRLEPNQQHHSVLLALDWIDVVIQDFWNFMPVGNHEGIDYLHGELRYFLEHRDELNPDSDA